MGSGRSRSLGVSRLMARAIGVFGLTSVFGEVGGSGCVFSPGLIR